MTPRDAVMAKVLHLRELARKNTSTHEAAAAAAAAERLIAAHNLDEAELEARSGRDASGAARDETPIVVWTGGVPGWERVLGAVLAEHYDCIVYRSIEGKDPKTRRTSLYAYGRAADVSTLRYMYSWLAVELARLGQAVKRGIRATYLHGGVHGVIVAMRDARAQARAAASPGALVVLSGRLAKVEAAFAADHPEVTSGRPIRKPTNEDAYAAGYEAGKELGRRQDRRLSERTES